MRVIPVCEEKQRLNRDEHECETDEYGMVETGRVKMDRLDGVSLSME